MGLAATEKRVRIATELVRLKRLVEATDAHVQQTAVAVVQGIQALQDETEGDENFTQADLEEIAGVLTLLSETTNSRAEQLNALVNPPQQQQE